MPCKLLSIYSPTHARMPARPVPHSILRCVWKIHAVLTTFMTFHADAAKTDAFGHFAAAAFRKFVSSLLFHELNSSKPSWASSEVIFGNFNTSTTSLPHCPTESGVSNFRTLKTDSVRLAQSLFLDRYSSLYWERFTDGGRSVNSDLMTSADFAGTPSMSLSRASLNLMVCSWILECSLSRAAAATRHLRARRYFSNRLVSKRWWAC